MSNLLFPLKDFNSEIADEFTEIMAQEAKMHNWPDYIQPDPEFFYRISALLAEIAKNSTVLRSHNTFYHVTDDTIAYESDASHTLLASSIMLWCLLYIDGAIVSTEHLLKLVFIMFVHDLPENVIGDIPDNGNQDRLAKHKSEAKYWSELLKLLPEGYQDLTPDIMSVLTGMDSANTKEQKLCYLADKLSAVITTLTLDHLAKLAHDGSEHASQAYLNVSPVKHFTDHDVTDRDIKEMLICDYDAGGYYKASEMWTIDFLRARNLADHDDSGFFTALLVMYTLMINGSWYHWRNCDYQEFSD